MGAIVVGVNYLPSRGDPGWAVVRSYQGVMVENAPPGVAPVYYSGDPQADWDSAWNDLAPWVLGFAIETSDSVEWFVHDTEGWFVLDEDGMLVRGHEAPGAIRAAAA